MNMFSKTFVLLLMQDCVRDTVLCISKEACKLRSIVKPVAIYAAHVNITFLTTVNKAGT